MNLELLATLAEAETVAKKYKAKLAELDAARIERKAHEERIDRLEDDAASFGRRWRVLTEELREHLAGGADE